MKKRVCFIIESMEGGGTQKNLHILMNTFENDNVKLFLITYKKNKKDKFYLKKNIKRYFANVPLHSSNFFFAIFNNLKRIRILRKSIKGIQPHSVVSFLPSTNILTIMSVLGLKIRILVSERNDLEKQKLNFFWSILRFIFYRFSDVIICNSKNAVNSVKKKESYNISRKIGKTKKL